MFDFFLMGGFMMWILLFMMIIILILTIQKLFQLFGKQKYSPADLERGIHGILFWGGLSAVIGFFAHFWGMYEAMMSISQANDISPAIVAEGYGVSLIAVLTGLFIFILSAVLWFFFRWRFKQLVKKAG
jgi:biopolymer transport protein ExbB/TolQ